MVEPDPDDFAIFAMCIIDPSKLLAIPGAQREPYVAELGNEWARDMSKVLVCGEVRQDVIQDKPDCRKDASQRQILLQRHLVTV